MTFWQGRNSDWGLFCFSWPYLLNWVEYFDKQLRKHWYWQDLAQEIVKWQFSLVEALPSSKFWKCDNGPISWTEWNIVMKFCIHIDTDKMYPMWLSNDIWDWFEFLPRFKFWNKWDYCKMTFIIGRGFAERQILKKWKWPYLLNWVEYFDRLLRKHWYYPDLAQDIVKCYFSFVISEKVKTALSLQLSGILCWNFVYTLVSWQDVAHEIVKWHLGLVEVLPRFEFWKKWKLTPKPFGICW